MSEQQIRLKPLFLVNQDDQLEIQALREAHAPFMVSDLTREPGDYARKINRGVQYTTAAWLLAGADDLDFQPGWADEAIRVAKQAGCRFVATNDQVNPEVIHGRHATHPLVHRTYIQEYGVIDEPGKLYWEGYDHQCIDVEASKTAQYHGEFVFARHSIVSHLHPVFHKGQMDDTYRLGLQRGQEDRALYHERAHLWGGR